MEELINIPDYWTCPVKPRGFLELCDMVETQGRITGIWELVQWDPKTGEIRKRVVNKNVVTDNGAINILQRAINSSSATLPNLFNNLLITNNSGSTTLTSALTANATNVTSLAVAATPAAIPSGTVLTLGYGQTSNTQTVTTNGSTAQGATSITVNSFTVNSAGFAVGAAVVPNPAVTDNPNNAGLTSNASSPLSAYSGNLATGAFTFNATTGAGNRNVVVTFSFTNAGGVSVGNYTDCWITNVSSGATTNNYVAHEINAPMRVDASNSINATCTIKI